MDEVLDVIDAALEKRGLKDATASRMAVGNPNLIKNMRKSREKSGVPRYSYESLKRLAEVLKLELYFGPPREELWDKSAHQRRYAMSEAKAEFSADVPVLPAPDLPEQPDMPRITVPRKWLEARGITPAKAALVRVGDGGMDPIYVVGATALIDQGDTDVEARQGAAFAVRIAGRVLLRRCTLTARALIAHPVNPQFMIEEVPKSALGAADILGRLRAVISNVD